MRYNPDSWAIKGLSVDGGSLLLNLFMYWSLSEGLMHKGIIRLLKGVFMDKFSIHNILESCAVVMGHLDVLDPEKSLSYKEDDTIVDEIKSSMRMVDEEYFVAKELEDNPLDMDILVRVDNSLARALGYFYLYHRTGEEYLASCAYSAMSNAAVDLMALVSDACDDEDDSEMDESFKDDGINRPWGVAGVDDPIVEYEEE